MTADRMRRVDEAMREVLSGAITSELKDPRVGFVTVTSVDTAPDLRHARVYVSVLGTDSVRRRSLDGLRSAHGFLQRRVADELHLKHTPTLDFVYDDTLDRAHADRRAARARGARTDVSENGAKPTREQALATLRDHDKFLLTTHERPDGDARRLAGGHAARAHGARQGRASRSSPRTSSRCPTSTASSSSTGSSPSRPTDLAERVMVFLDCGNIDRTPAAALKREGRWILNIDHHHDNTRFGTLNHVDPSASCTAEMVWDLMKGLGVEATPAIAEALYVGAGDRHRPLHVREHRRRARTRWPPS